MIAAFSTKIKEKETHFVSKIWSGLLKNGLANIEEVKRYEQIYRLRFFKELNIDLSANPKLHTLREDSKNRWKVRVMIDFFINCRKEDMFRFAPKLLVKGIQNVFITRNDFGKSMVFIDGKLFYLEDWSLEHKHKMLHFAQNDGFETTEDFFEYFDTDFNGKIIHWTNLKY